MSSLLRAVALHRVSPRAAARGADGRAPASTGFGTIAGHVTLTTRVTARRSRRTSIQRERSAHTAPAIPEIRNVVVYLKDVGVSRRAAARRKPNSGRNTRRSSRTCSRSRAARRSIFRTAIRSSTTSSRSRAPATFDLGRYPRGQSRGQRSSRRPGLVKVYCDIHSHMSARSSCSTIRISRFPSVDGSFELPNVPAGRVHASWAGTSASASGADASASSAGQDRVDGRPDGAGRGSRP